VPTLQLHPTVSGRLLKISYACVTVALMMTSDRTVSQQLLPRSLQRSLVLWTNRTTKTNRIKTTRMLQVTGNKEDSSEDEERALLIIKVVYRM
jgi:hypothetical protein